MLLAIAVAVYGLFTRNTLDSNSTTFYIIGGFIAFIGWVVSRIRSKNHNPNADHPGRGDVNSQKAEESEGIVKADYEACLIASQQEWEARFHQCLMNVMILTAAADGNIETSELESICEIFQQITNDEWLVDEVIRRSQLVIESRDEVIAELSLFSSKLTEDAKMLYIRAIIAIATANENMPDKELGFLAEIGAILEIDESRWKNLVAG